MQNRFQVFSPFMLSIFIATSYLTITCNFKVFQWTHKGAFCKTIPEEIKTNDSVRLEDFGANWSISHGYLDSSYRPKFPSEKSFVPTNYV